LHRDELERLRARVAQERLTLVPLSIYFRDGRAKVELALAKGRTHGDRRQAIAERDAARDTARDLARHRKGTS
jgi:SsrA-binding protein